MLLATALACAVLGILLLGGAWKRGWFGGAEKGTAQEMVFDLGNGVKMTLCWCPPGTFLMGSPATEAGRQEDEVQHEVTLTRGFWMAKTETTQAQWKALRPDNPSHFKGDRLPVGSVTWHEAKAFAAALTERLRREGKLEAGWEFRLPTEAQWEYACRAGTATAYSSGNGEAALRKTGWYVDNSRKKPSRFRAWLESLPMTRDWFQKHPGPGSWPHVKQVGGKIENAFGLQDMHGNVPEWCEDWYARYPSAKETDSKGPSSGFSRVFRGGSSFSDAASCRSAARGMEPTRHRELLEIGFFFTSSGFRVCLVPGPAATGTPDSSSRMEPRKLD